MPVTPGPEGVKEEMRRFKAGNLHSGKGGKIVKSRKQAIAISLHEAGMSRDQKPKRNSLRRNR
jgi:hypothetical protein